MRWRKLGAWAFELGAIPAVVAMSAIPRRQFNLPWLVGSSEFAAIRGEYTAWQDRHFEVIEQRAPWLRLVGRDVYETCSGRVPRPSALLDFSPRHPPAVGAARQVTAVYGFDGPEAQRLRSLELAFPAAGWETGGTGYRDKDLQWRPGAVIGHPSFGGGMPPWGGGRPPFAPRMRVSWQSAGQAIIARRDPNRASSATRNRLPLENSDVQLPGLLERVLRWHGHAMTVTMDLSYYANLAPRSSPHRVRLHFLPTR